MAPKKVFSVNIRFEYGFLFRNVFEPAFES